MGGRHGHIEHLRHGTERVAGAAEATGAIPAAAIEGRWTTEALATMAGGGEAGERALPLKRLAVPSDEVPAADRAASPSYSGGVVRERRRSGEIVLERRRIPRLPLRTEVTCLFGGVSLSATTTNLTAAGCFVETGTPVPHDAVVDLTLHLSDDPNPAKVSGRVVRVVGCQDDTPGFAVEFDSLDDATCTRITNLVERATAFAGSTKTTEIEVAPCARCGHETHHGPKGGPLACTNARCDCDEYVSCECPGYLGKAKAGDCPGVFGEHLDGCPDATP